MAARARERSRDRGERRPAAHRRARPFQPRVQQPSVALAGRRLRGARAPSSRTSLGRAWRGRRAPRRLARPGRDPADGAPRRTSGRDAMTRRAAVSRPRRRDPPAARARLRALDRRRGSARDDLRRRHVRGARTPPASSTCAWPRRRFAATHAAAQIATAPALAVAGQLAALPRAPALGGDAHRALQAGGGRARRASPESWHPAARVSFGHGWVRAGRLRAVRGERRAAPAAPAGLCGGEDPLAALSRGRSPGARRAPAPPRHRLALEPRDLRPEGRGAPAHRAARAALRADDHRHARERGLPARADARAARRGRLDAARATVRARATGTSIAPPSTVSTRRSSGPPREAPSPQPVGARALVEQLLPARAGGARRRRCRRVGGRRAARHRRGARREPADRRALAAPRRSRASSAARSRRGRPARARRGATAREAATGRPVHEWAVGRRERRGTALRVRDAPRERRRWATPPEAFLAGLGGPGLAARPRTRPRRGARRRDAAPRQRAVGAARPARAGCAAAPCPPSICSASSARSRPRCAPPGLRAPDAAGPAAT